MTAHFSLSTLAPPSITPQHPNATYESTARPRPPPTMRCLPQCAPVHTALIAAAPCGPFPGPAQHQSRCCHPATPVALHPRFPHVNRLSRDPANRTLPDCSPHHDTNIKKDPLSSRLCSPTGPHGPQRTLLWTTTLRTRPQCTAPGHFGGMNLHAHFPPPADVQQHTHAVMSDLTDSHPVPSRAQRHESLARQATWRHRRQPPPSPRP